MPSDSAPRSAGSSAATPRRYHAVGSTKAGGTVSPAAPRRIRFQALLPTSATPPAGSGPRVGTKAMPGEHSGAEGIFQHLFAEEQARTFQRIGGRLELTPTAV
jgi:hypothetical protein